LICHEIYEVQLDGIFYRENKKLKPTGVDGLYVRANWFCRDEVFVWEHAWWDHTHTI